MEKREGQDGRAVCERNEGNAHTFRLLEHALHGARAARAGHLDVELVVVGRFCHFFSLFFRAWALPFLLEKTNRYV